MISKKFKKQLIEIVNDHFDDILGEHINMENNPEFWNTDEKVAFQIIDDCMRYELIKKIEEFLA